MYVNASVPKKRGPVGSPAPKKSLIILVNTRDVETFPARNDKGVLITEDLVLKTGALAIGIYATASSISRAKVTEGDEEDAEGFRSTLVFQHPGSTLEIDEFHQNNLGEGFIIISEECGDNKGTRLYGDMCNPMKFALEGQDDSEAKRDTLTFTQPMRSGFVPAHYRGVMPALAPDSDSGGSAGTGI